MSQRNKSSFPIEAPEDFGDDDFVLNYRPRIGYVEPDQISVESTLEPEPPQLEDIRNRVEDLIKGYRAVQQLADATQKRVDARVKAAGGMTVKLDPVIDAPTIAALKRQFPDQDPTIVDFDKYRTSLIKQRELSPEGPTVTSADIRAAKPDNLRTNFGGVNNVQGENRAEVSSPAKTLKPVDLDALQAAQVVALFALMLPMISNQDSAAISRHVKTTPHA
jgi:hypothetical protein